MRQIDNKLIRRSSFYDGDLLYIVIADKTPIGVFSTVKDAQEGITLFKERYPNPILSCQVMIPNTTMGMNYSVLINDILNRPEYVELKVRTWNGWENIINHHNKGYNL